MFAAAERKYEKQKNVRIQKKVIKIAQTNKAGKGVWIEVEVEKKGENVICVF